MEKFFGFFIAAALAFSATSAQAQPVAVSPGSDTGEATTDQTCPTFSWSSVEEASAYTVAIFEMQTSKILPYKEMRAIASPVLSFNIGAPSLSWTPSSGECLTRGMKYVWYVRGVDQDGKGQWSEPKGFEVEASALTLEQKDAVNEAVKAYLSTEEAKRVASATRNSGAQATATRPSSGSAGAKKGAETRVAAVAGGSGLADQASLVIFGNMAVNDSDIMLRTATDTNHGLGWYGPGKTFAGVGIDGAVLYGWNGGILGSTDPQTIAVSWDWQSNVSVVGNLTVGSTVTANSFAYSTPQTEYLMLAGGACKQYPTTNTTNPDSSTPFLCQLSNSSNTFTGYWTVDIPQGATIVGMLARAWTAGGTTTTCRLRTGLDGQNSTTIATLTDSPPDFGWHTTPEVTFSHVVDKSTYAYAVDCSNPTLSINNADIGYVRLRYTKPRP